MKNLLALGLLAGLGYVTYKAVTSDEQPPAGGPKPATPPKTTTPTTTTPTPTTPSGDLIPIPIPGVPSWPTGGSGWPGIPGVPVPGTATPGVPAPSTPTPATPAAPPNVWAKCWQTFKPTGKSEADLQQLASTCAAGLAQIGDPVTLPLSTGKETLALSIEEAGYYRVIVVGGSGITNVDAELFTLADQRIAVDITPEDKGPTRATAVLHPRGNLVYIDSPQVLKLVITVEGKGNVSLGVWKDIFAGYTGV